MYPEHSRVQAEGALCILHVIFWAEMDKAWMWWGKGASTGAGVKLFPQRGHRRDDWWTNHRARSPTQNWTWPLPANAAGKDMEDGPHPRMTWTSVGDPGWWLQPGPALVIVIIWEVSQWMEALSVPLSNSPSLFCNSAFQINKMSFFLKAPDKKPSGQQHFLLTQWFRHKICVWDVESKQDRKRRHEAFCWPPWCCQKVLPWSSQTHRNFRILSLWC